jgi:hypothetical protein
MDVIQKTNTDDELDACAEQPAFVLLKKTFVLIKNKIK